MIQRKLRGSFTSMLPTATPTTTRQLHRAILSSMPNCCAQKFRTWYFPPHRKSMRAKTEHLLTVSIPHYQRDLQESLKQFAGVPDTIPGPPITPDLMIGVAIQRGVERFEGVKCPVLAIFADPHAFGPAGAQDPSKLAQMAAEDKARVSEQADAFQAGNPQARVIRIPNADHFIYRSNESDVLREIDAFMATLH